MIRPVHCREAVALFLNIAFAFSSEDFAREMCSHPEWFYDGNQQSVPPETAIAQMRQTRRINAGLVNSGYAQGLGGGRIWGVTEAIYRCHYTNKGGDLYVIFHEFGHVMGYMGHNSGFDSPGNNWAGAGMPYYYQHNLSRFPVDSPDYLNTESNPNLYYPW